MRISTFGTARTPPDFTCAEHKQQNNDVFTKIPEPEPIIEHPRVALCIPFVPKERQRLQVSNIRYRQTQL